MNKPVAWKVWNRMGGITFQLRKPSDSEYVEYEPLYTHPVKEQDDYCKAYWGNDNKFVDVFLPNSEKEVIRFWNNTHPVKELTDEIVALLDGIDKTECEYENGWWETSIGAEYGADILEKIKAILRKAQEK